MKPLLVCFGLLTTLSPLSGCSGLFQTEEHAAAGDASANRDHSVLLAKSPGGPAVVWKAAPAGATSCFGPSRDHSSSRSELIVADSLAR
jgi:hypothetical protein